MDRIHQILRNIDIDPFIVILLVGYLLLGFGISYVTSVEVTIDGVLILCMWAVAIVVFLCFLKQMGWLRLGGDSETPAGQSAVERRLQQCVSSLRSTWKTMLPQETTAEAIEVVNEYVGGAEDRLSMDPGIVFLVFAQLFFATLIAYGTAVEVTGDGLLTFIFCSMCGFVVLTFIRHSRWTLYVVGRSRIPKSWGMARGWKAYCQWQETNGRRVLAYIRLLCMIILPIQLALFPLMWLLTTLRVVPMWVIDFAHAEESWALWLLAALSVVGALVPIYRTHGSMIFGLTMLLLAVLSAAVFALAWAVQQPLLASTALVALCIGAVAVRHVHVDTMVGA